MKKKMIAAALAATMTLGMGTVAFAEEPVETKIALITMDQMDVHWVRLQEAAQAKVDEYNEEGNKIEMTWMAPETKDNQQQIEKIEAAIADNVNYIIISCNDATAANMQLQEAMDAGIKVIYVDATADLEASATFATDNFAGGVQAGEYMKKVLDEAGVKEGTIGIVDAQAGVDSCQARYDGFASVFEGTDFELGERQYSDGDNTKAQELANTLIANGVVAIYGTNDGATNGAAAAVADAKIQWNRCLLCRLGQIGFQYRTCREWRAACVHGSEPERDGRDGN